jgi:hypothetical protein
MTGENDLFTPSDDHGLPQEPAAPVAPAEVDYLSQLVGEGKKFDSAESLARGKAEADMFVERLQGELKGLRDELKTRTSLDEFMDKMNSQQPTEAPVVQPNIQEQPPAEPAGIQNMSPEQIESLLEQKLTQREQEINQTRNLEEVKSKLLKHFGDNYQNTLKTKAAELGLGEQFLDDLAKTQPKAFTHLLGLDGEVSPAPSSVYDNSPVLPNQQNSSAVLGSAPAGQMKFNDFEKIRKSDPDTYWSPAVQNKMHKAALSQGGDFYN